MPDRDGLITLEKPLRDDEARPRRRQPFRLVRRDDFRLVRSQPSNPVREEPTLTLDRGLVSKIEVLHDRLIIYMREE